MDRIINNNKETGKYLICGASRQATDVPFENGTKTMRATMATN